MKEGIKYILVILIFLTGYCSFNTSSNQESLHSGRFNQGEREMIKKVEKTEKEWKEILTPEEYRVMRKGSTEKPFSGKYNDHYEKGIYYCAGCSTPLFSSRAKYDHYTGWPSFTAPVNEKYVLYREDNSFFMRRTEVKCSVCGAHLGHVFHDGPPPTNKHYCINSIALHFKPSASFSERPDQKIVQSDSSKNPGKSAREAAKPQKATFAAGCFWGVEHKFRQLPGVLSTVVGYTGGHAKNPTYRQVCGNQTGHAEAIEILFDPSQVSYEELLVTFFRIHDPTQLNRQGPDIGTQYRSAIFYHSREQKEAAEKMIEKLQKSGRYHKSLVTQTAPASKFYKAEEYHQQYVEKQTRGK